MRDLGADAIISVVAPIYNEVEGIKPFVEELEAEFKKMGYSDRYELILVNDGSTDGTERVIDLLVANCPGEIKAVHFSRNFGHASAVYAGLEQAKGEVLDYLSFLEQKEEGTLARIRLGLTQMAGREWYRQWVMCCVLCTIKMCIINIR